MEDNQNNNFEEKPRVEPVNYTASMYTDTGFAADNNLHDLEREMVYYFCKGTGDSEPAASLVDKTVAGKGFSVCAFLFGCLYLLYRKCYIEVGVLFLVGFGVSGIGAVLYPWGSLILSLIIGTILGFTFPWLYHNKMEKVYNRALAEGQDPRAELRKAGGTNWIILATTLGILMLACILQYA